MTKNLTSWEPGHTGNPKGRPKGRRVLTEILKVAFEDTVVIGNEELPGKAAMALMVREVVLRGEVWVSGRRYAAETLMEWFAVVKWVYEHTDGKAPDVGDEEPEMIIRVVREDDED